MSHFAQPHIQSLQYGNSNVVRRIEAANSRNRAPIFMRLSTHAHTHHFKSRVRARVFDGIAPTILLLISICFCNAGILFVSLHLFRLPTAHTRAYIHVCESVCACGCIKEFICRLLPLELVDGCCYLFVDKQGDMQSRVFCMIVSFVVVDFVCIKILVTKQKACFYSVVFRKSSVKITA